MQQALIEKPVLSCRNVIKNFMIMDQGLSWRILFGIYPKNSSMFTALSGVTLDVPKGKFIGILGRNGAGKSTLLRTLAGVYAPDQGIISINGSLTGLFEFGGGFGDSQITGLEYATRALQLLGAKKHELPVLIADIYEFSELEENFHKKIYTYSSGMAARLYFAVATAMLHDIYLVDEVLSVGDEHFQAKCWQRLRDRFGKGASGILVTHDWTATLKLCEETHILDQGKIIYSGKTDKVVQHYLDLPKPSGKIAHFNLAPNQVFTAESGKDTHFTFYLTLNKNIPINFNYSIETLNVGIGWDILLLNKKFIFLTAKKGKHCIHLRIPKLPLSAGQYSLNLFLNSDDSNVNPLDLDDRSWTYGNGLELIVTGHSSLAKTRLPWRWKNNAIDG